MAENILIKRNLKDSFKLDPSTISLIFVNIITLILAIIQNWEITTIFYIYLFQTIVILFFLFIKFSITKRLCFSETWTFFVMLIIFIIFYCSFLFFIFGIPKLNFFIFLNAGLFFINHLFSFIYNFKKDSKKKELAKVLIKKITCRLLVMHSAIVFSFFLVFTFKKSIGFILSIIVFFIIKIPADVYYHNKEHQTDGINIKTKKGKRKWVF